MWAVAQQPFDLRPLQATICPPDMSLAVACCPPLDSAWMQQRGNPPSASRRLATSSACGRGLHLTSPPPLGSSRVTLEILRPYVGYCPRPSFVQDHADSQRKENLRMPCFMLPRPRARCWEHHTRQRPNRSTLRGTGIAISRTANSVTADLQLVTPSSSPPRLAVFWPPNRLNGSDSRSFAHEWRRPRGGINPSSNNSCSLCSNMPWPPPSPFSR